MNNEDRLSEALDYLIRCGKQFRNTVVETRGVRGMDGHDEAIIRAEKALAAHESKGEVSDTEVDAAAKAIATVIYGNDLAWTKYIDCAEAAILAARNAGGES